MKGRRMLSPWTKQPLLPEITLVYLDLGKRANFLFPVHTDAQKEQSFFIIPCPS
jgi:hypothetical protein